MNAKEITLGCGIIGYGKAARSLIASCNKNGIPVHAIYSRKGMAPRVKPEDDKMGAEDDISSFISCLKSHQTKILFLAVNDDSISTIANALSNQEWLPKTVCHLSGARDLSVLETLDGKANIAMFHPLACLDGSSPIPEGTLLGLQARKPETISFLSNFAASLNLMPGIVSAGSQALYHAAAVTAANLPLALFAHALKMMEKAGIDEETARVGLARLLKSSIANIENKPLSCALTGPVARADVETIRNHLSAMSQLNDSDHMKNIYAKLSIDLLDISNISSEQKILLRNELSI